MSGIHLNISHVSTHLMFKIILWEKYYEPPYWIDKKMETQESKEIARWWSHS